MSVLAIILIVVGVLAVAFAIGGWILIQRRRERDHAALIQQAEQADQHLAQAHAEDKGWERVGLESSARAAYAQRYGVEPRQLMLVQVVDRPGTDEDEAVFHADGKQLVLARRGEDWVARD
jgi:Flp pilus assembly protein TadB